jgi:hypothetical protein
MLNAHEFATLVPVRHAQRISDVDQSDLRTLLDRKLIEFDVGASTQPRMTNRGHALMARLHVMRQT